VLNMQGVRANNKGASEDKYESGFVIAAEEIPRVVSEDRCVQDSYRALSSEKRTTVFTQT
jgi:hypothetical protein